MKKHKTLLIAGLIILLVISGLYFLFKEDEDISKAGGEPKQLMEFSDIDLNEEKDGKVIWNLKVQHVKIENNRNVVHLTGIDGFFANEENELKITAKEGLMKRNEQLIYLEGEVEGKTKDGLILHAKNLTYDGNKQILSTDRSFVAEKDGRILTADSFTADRVLEKIVAKGNARLADKEDN